MKMKKLFSYLESLTPTLTDNQRKHIEMLVKDMVGNESQIQYGNGYRDGRTVGRREGESGCIFFRFSHTLFPLPTA